jgi:hypothetical protein
VDLSSEPYTSAAERDAQAGFGRAALPWAWAGRFLSRHKVVFAAFLASRLALLAVGLMTQIFIEPFSTQVSTLKVTDNAVLRIWAQWDSGWYLTLAEHGYSAHPEVGGQANWVFFPAYPFLSAAIANLAHIPVLVAMLSVSNLSFLAGLLLTHRFARLEFDRRTADLTVVLLCAAPGSYIFSSAYTESLFLFATAGCLLLLRSEKWLAAGSFAALAVLTRNLGMALVLPFAMTAGPRLWALWREGRARTGPPARGRLASEAIRVGAGFALPALALAGFCFLLYRTCGDPLAFVTAQKAWGRAIGNPLATPFTGVFSKPRIPSGDLVSFVASWLSIGMLAALAFMRRWRLLVLGCALVLAPLATGLPSYARYSLVVLPGFVAAARLLATRPVGAMATLVTFSTLNGFLMVAWVLGMWVTT